MKIYYISKRHPRKKIKLSKFLILLVASIWLCMTPIFESSINYQELIKNSTTDQLEANNEVVVNTQQARITCYNWTGSKMANGLYPKEGYVATSDRTIPLGNIIEIEGIKYEVGDRTNKRIHNQFGMLTIDIYKNDCDLNFGAHKKLVKFY